MGKAETKPLFTPPECCEASLRALKTQSASAAAALLAGEFSLPLTKIPDVRVKAHLFHVLLELQAGISHCQFLARVGVPGEMRSCPLGYVWIPFW